MSFVFYSKTGDGGYGDRIVGLISVYMISKIMKKNFYILWESPLIDNFVSNKMSCLEDTNSFTYLRLIDERCDPFRKRLENEKLEDIFPDENIKFSCNQNIIQHLYLNKNYDLKIENYEDDISFAYKKLYTEFFICKDNLLNTVNGLVCQFSNYDDVIGIHIRTGDFNMGLTQHLLYNSKTLEELIKKLINKINTMFNNNYALYVMSDYEGIEKIFEKYSDKKIFYHNIEIMHIDMIKKDNNVDNGMLKLFADHITFSKCSNMISHSSSNLGKTASIIGDGKKYTIGSGFIDEISVKKLSSKSLYI